MQHSMEHPFARTMYILGQIGAIICHDRGPKIDTSILTEMATTPATGFWLAVSGMNDACPPTRSASRALLHWKRKEIARLSRMLPHPLPEEASSQEQVPFWAGYCQYWEGVLKTHVEQTTEPTRVTDELRLRHLNA
jgi:hypothetical protein